MSNDQRGPRRSQPARSSAPRPRPVSPAREVAYAVLEAVDEADAYANLLLPVLTERRALSTADAGLATELSYGTLRMQGYYDAVIELAARRPAAEIDPPLLRALRLGAHQLLATRVPEHAAVDESVSLARLGGSRSGVGFVNGVLRTIARSTPEQWRERVREATPPGDEQLAREYSHPAWVIRAMRQALRAEGREEELLALLEANNTAPRVNLVALPGLAERPADAEEDLLSPVGFTSAGGDPATLVRSSSGRIRVQDEGSQLVALALSRAAAIRPGERWLDLCSGPGGKTALLAAEALSAGAQLDAVELMPARAELVRRAVEPVPLSVPVAVRDGRGIGTERPGYYDRVLVDAPCTGLGALRRRPESRWRKRPSGVAELGELQASLLRSAFAATRPGGLILYATCSPHVAETRAIVQSALEEWGTGAELLDAADVLAEVTGSPVDLGAGLERDGGRTAQLWPHRHRTDAMFLALIRRRDAR